MRCAKIERSRRGQHAQGADLMEGVGTSVSQAERVLDDMMASMSEIRDASDRVSNIIKTIDESAFQTRLGSDRVGQVAQSVKGIATQRVEVQQLIQQIADAGRLLRSQRRPFAFEARPRNTIS